MRFEYLSVKDTIAAEHDKARLHGRILIAVHLSKEETASFFEESKALRNHSGPEQLDHDENLNMWDGIRIIHTGVSTKGITDG